MTLPVACRHVAAALRPRDRAAIGRVCAGSVGDWLWDRIVDRVDVARSVPWWDAHAAGLVAALVTVTDVDEHDAGVLLGASLQALISAGQDLAPDGVLRLAERAACYAKGTQ